MATVIFFLVGVALALLFAFATIAVMRKSYRDILEKLCGTAERARYWARLSEICLVVVTLFAALRLHGYRALERSDMVKQFWGLMGQVSWILAAVFASLIVIAIVIVRSLPREGRRIKAPQPTPRAG
jgi:hypothetical protein